ncbi:probable protein phosphatase 2C 26 [Malus sylvestris]|uniref:probable protein phosphatase 2C 26 n=1 Tax=Malus sylvestris TaxID=3752 RepID=UPI0021ACDE19|nr:probable protein phosphatase 2C 26 [Malus sylvestris]
MMCNLKIDTCIIPRKRCQTRPACILYLILYIFLCVEKGGEDAFFVSSYNGGVLAIADGVSGCAEQDVDPSFPKELMANASNFVGDEEVNNNPHILIQKAHAYTSSIGSAMNYCLAGEEWDSENCQCRGLQIKGYREGKINFSTSPQEHYFDCPYQEIVGQTYHDATVSNVELMEGDTVVMGSDGLFDNVFNREIVSTVAGYRDVAEAVLANASANLANNHSLDSNFDSPYSMEARSRGFEPPLWKKILGMKLTGTTYLGLYYDDKDLNLRCHDGPEFSVVQVESRMISL